MDRYEFSFRIVNTISELLKERHGEISRIERILGTKDYLRSMRRGPKRASGVKLRLAGAFLELGGIEPEDFWPRAFPEGTNPLARFMAEARRLEEGTTVPKVLRDIRKRHAAGELRDTVCTARASDIDELWKERRENSTRAARRAAVMARHATERPFVARALSVWAAILRESGDLKLATVVLGVALELGESYPTVLADLARRAAYVLSDRARFHNALELAEFALIRYARNGDKLGVGRALIDNGTFLDRCGDPEQAIASYMSALDYLPRSASFNRYSAHQNLAIVYVSKGNLRAAEYHLHRALVAPVVLPEIEAARLYWLRARIAQARRENLSAIQLFEKTLALLENSPANYAMAATELVLLRLEAGQVAEAVAQAKQLAPVALQINNEIVEGAVANLIMASTRGELTLAVAKALWREMENGGAGAAVPRPHPKK